MVTWLILDLSLSILEYPINKEIKSTIEVNQKSFEGKKGCIRDYRCG